MRTKLLMTVALLLPIFLWMLTQFQWKSADPIVEVQYKTAADIGPSLGVGLLDSGLIQSWKEQGYTQTWTAEDFRDVQIVDSTQQTNGSWHEDVYAESTSFNIHVMNSGGKDLFCIAGASGEDFVIECWRLKRKKFAPLNQSSPPKRIEKTELFRGTLELPVHSLAIDPERRFVIVVAGDGQSRMVCRFSLSTPGTPTILQTGLDLPALQEVKYVDRLQHVSFGRVWLLQGLPTDVNTDLYVVYTDADNDGTFDLPIVDNLSGMIARGFIGENLYWDEFDGMNE